MTASTRSSSIVKSEATDNIKQQQHKIKQQKIRRRLFAVVYEIQKSTENASWERDNAPTATTRSFSTITSSTSEKAKEKVAEENREVKKEKNAATGTPPLA